MSKIPTLNGNKKVVFCPRYMHCQARITTNTKITVNGSVLKSKPYGNDRALLKQKPIQNPLAILQDMQQRDSLVDSDTYASIIQGCKLLPEGKLVHAHIIIHSGFKPNVYLENTLLNMYTKCDSLEDARRVLEKMPKRNAVSWTVMIAAHAKNGDSEEALKLYYQMRKTGVQPNQFTFASVLPACCNLGALKQGKEIHQDIIKSGFLSDAFVGSTLVDMYVKCGSIEDARQVFDKMPVRDVVAWTSMVAGYAQHGLVNEALELFRKMPERNVVSWTAMIAGCAQHPSFGKARKLFWRMPEQDVISWNAMIARCAQKGYSAEALKLFEDMKMRGVIPDSDTFSGVLMACTNSIALEQGKEIHQEIMRRGLMSDVFIGNALIDMYAKCGSIEEACQVFDEMPKRDVVSWTAMISGYAIHGLAKEAVCLFKEMQESGTTPDYVTFIGVLSACCHAGLLDAARQFFDCMSRVYHIKPVMEHYCCMVDLLGRAGLLEEALEFINKMPTAPNAIIWGSLLSACRIHCNVDLGEQVAEYIFDLEPRNPAPHLLLLNIYAGAGRWDDADKVRSMMNFKGIKRKAGCSWIEVNKKMHTFVEGNRSHSQTQEIYAVLETLSGQMKEAGYVPETKFVLNDLDIEQKNHIFCHHGEKLTLAFGLINTSPGTPIRILKNLRVCGDCHSAVKFISKIVAQEIIVRDASRFHHFKDGLCSCGNYW